MELKELVIQEVENLKKHATSKEISQLNTKTLDEQNAQECIYGQMTGSCHSSRSLELFQLCAKPYSSILAWFQKPQNVEFKSISTRDWSALEFYIYQNPKEGVKIIEYLKGNIKTLKLV